MWLSITAGEGKGLAVRVEGERCLVGSGRECRLVVHDDGVDPIHALFEIDDDGEVEVQDLRTKTGTFVNGERIEGTTAVKDGDEIRIGSTVLTATTGDPADSDAVEDPAVEVQVPAEPPGPVAEEDAVALVTAPEGTHVEVVPGAERRRLRDRVRLATALGGAAAGIAIVTLIAVLAFGGGGDDSPSTEEIVADVTPSTVLVRVADPLRGPASGSGWVLDAEEGLIVTNFHVVNGATGVTVTGQESSGDAKMVGAAPCEDLAVLKVDETEGLKTLPMGSQEDLKQGEQVVAIGYPANASNDGKLTSTAGVVSIVETSFKGAPDAPEYPNVVQTDAALNPGNSGGPLVDQDKRLVGVNAAGLLSVEGTPISAQGYAIGVDRVKTVVKELREGRSRAWGGFGFVFATDRQAKEQGIPAEGVLVTPAVPGTPAAEADIAASGSLLLAVDGVKLEGTLPDYCRVMSELNPSQKVPVTLLDKPGAKPRTVSINFG